MSLRNEVASRATRRGTRARQTETPAVAEITGTKSQRHTKRCIAVVPESASGDGWVPCGKPRAKGSEFCQAHRDAVHGAVLALLLRAAAEEAALEASILAHRAAAKRRAASYTHPVNAA